MNICRRYTVSGRVQGVCFRAETQQLAQRLGLTGWVRNLPDGRVELVACGEDASLKHLAAWLPQGPAHARVERVEKHDHAPQVFAQFEVRD